MDDCEIEQIFMIKGFYTIAVLELFLGGGGRLTEIGSVSFRMVIFGLCLCVTLWLMVTHFDYDRDAVFIALGLTVAYVAVHLFGVVNGVFRGADAVDIMSDLQPSLFWLIAPFFAVVLGSRLIVYHNARLICLTGILLAVFYMTTLLSLAQGFLDFSELYEKLNSTGEFFFRGDSFFFYKGFLYLAIATVFLIAISGRLAVLGAILVATALLLTLTRGFVISAAIVIILMLFSLRRWISMAVAVMLAAVAFFAVWIYLPEMTSGFSGQRDVSNNIRFDDMIFMLKNATPITLLVGEGFGSYINGRLNIENSYLWLWWKLGFLGLIFWLSPLVMAMFYYCRISRDDPDYRLGCAFFYSILLVYIQTATNPYLNNPIGLSFVLIALFSLRTLGKSVNSDGMRKVVL